MINSLKVTNFRSLKEVSMKLSPLTFFYGNNASGKSSVFYAFNVLKNIMVNPNQGVENFFNFGFINLGSFKQVVYKHDETLSMAFQVAMKIQAVSCQFKVLLKASSGEFSLDMGEPYNLKMKLPVTFPFPLNQQTEGQFQYNNVNYKVTWNGISAQVSTDVANEEVSATINKFLLIINAVSEKIRAVDVIPLKRGFTKPNYGVVSEGIFVTEEEVASKLAKDQYLDQKISHYLEQIMDRQFRVRNHPGATIVNLHTYEKDAAESYDLVNDGYGVNQLVYVLAKLLNKSSDLVCVEEPEINLHPGIVRKLPRVFVNIVREEKKQIFVSSHSEALIIAMLSAIPKGEVRKQDLAFYLTTKDGGITTFKKQEATKDGKVSGGLTSFMEGELDEIKAFLTAAKPEKEPEPLSDEVE